MKDVGKPLPEEKDLRLVVWPKSRTAIYLIAFSAVCTYFGYFRKDAQFMGYLFISNWEEGLFNEVLSGELWRIWTPIFLHFGFLHIFFNGTWVYDLSRPMEFLKSTKFLILFVIVVGGLSNIGQYLITGPRFGGLSGIVYGQLGFLWALQTRLERGNLFLRKFDIIAMVVWFLLCITGLLGGIANMAHGLGLSIGIFWGIKIELKEAKFKQIEMHFPQEKQGKSFWEKKQTLYFAILIIPILSMVGDIWGRKGRVHLLEQFKSPQEIKADCYQKPKSCIVYAIKPFLQNDKINLKKLVESRNNEEYRFAKEIANSACEQKSGRGCYVMALFSDIESNDEEEVINYIKLSCDYGFKSGCDLQLRR